MRNKKNGVTLTVAIIDLVLQRFYKSAKLFNCDSLFDNINDMNETINNGKAKTNKKLCISGTQ